MTTLIVGTNDSWISPETVEWVGCSLASGVSAFSDSNYVYIVGRHFTLSRKLASLSRIYLGYEVDMGDAVAGEDNPLLTNEDIGPETVLPEACFAHFLAEMGISLGSYFHERVVAEVYKDPEGYYNFGYPEDADGWLATEGIGMFASDALGLDHPDDPRVLVSTDEEDNSKIYIVHMGMGGEESITEGDISLLPVGAQFKDLESNRIIG